MTLDGSAPNHETLSAAQQPQVVVEGNSVVVTVPGNNTDELRDIGSTGRLFLRPVLHSIPAQPSSGQPGQPSPDLTARIAQEKQLRQSTSAGVQLLPLVTCSQDRSTAYLLAPSILGNDQIDSASSRFADSSGAFVIDLKFNSDATQTWTDFTASHLGTQVAFTLDSEVVSAPEIREAIQSGRTQISGGNPPFNAATARHLANVLNYRPLPMKFDASPSESVPPQPNSASFLSPPDWAVAAALSLLVILLTGLVCLSVPGLAGA